MLPNADVSNIQELVKDKILESLRQSPLKDNRGRPRQTRQSLFDQVKASIEQTLHFEDSEFRSYYRQAEQELVDTNQVERRKGPSGGIVLCAEETQNYKNERGNQDSFEEEHQKERNYYESIVNAIPDFWKSEFGAVDVVAEITASARGIMSGGTWTRPDIVVLATFDWVFSSRKEGIVTTIEIKTQKNFDITAVYEALAHRSRAHQSYLIVVSRDELEQNIFKRCLSEAEQVGVGLIEVKETDLNSSKSWIVHAEARQSDTDPFEIHDFIMSKNVVSVEARKKFIGYLRNVPREML